MLIFIFTKHIIIDKTYNGDVEFLIALVAMLISVIGVFWSLIFKLTSYFSIFGVLLLFGTLLKSSNLINFGLYFFLFSFLMQSIYWICETIDINAKKKKTYNSKSGGKKK